MSKALYRKYRSKTLDEVIGQDHITGVLARAIKRGKLSHAYLFTGPRGVGKTSVARILAYAINQVAYDEDHPCLDIIEIDAASNNGVDDVRSLREKAQIAPISAAKKIYIIDEVHMLSKPAFNALLKTLEEPPEHVIFILATTNLEKVPATIVSRTQNFNFRPIKLEQITKHLRDIASAEKIKISDDALELIAKHGEGSFRDSISLLDQVSNLSDQEVTSDLVTGALGLASRDLIAKILKQVNKNDLESVVATLEEAFAGGVDANLIARQLSDEIRLNITKTPQLIPLLDGLIDVEKSPRPQIKLLSTLGLFITSAEPSKKDTPEPKSESKSTPKNAALLATKPELTASVSELKKEIKAEKAEQAEKKRRTTSEPIELDWNKLLEYARQNNIALHSVLTKCGHELNGSDLTIYTANKFYQRKLDTPKYSLLLHEFLQAIGVDDIDIHTIPTTVPPKDDKMAAIAAMMGGGEEVTLES